MVTCRGSSLSLCGLDSRELEGRRVLTFAVFGFDGILRISPVGADASGVAISPTSSG